ncbi:hypothetical protein K8R61_01375 [bacterium]|nr:hypothetical protein [bacterium]
MKKMRKIWATIILTKWCMKCERLYGFKIWKIVEVVCECDNPMCRFLVLIGVVKSAGVCPYCMKEWKQKKQKKEALKCVS